MPAPKQADLNKPVTNRSRFSGRVVATRADDLPVWNNPARSLADHTSSDAPVPSTVVEAGGQRGEES